MTEVQSKRCLFLLIFMKMKLHKSNEIKWQFDPDYFIFLQTISFMQQNKTSFDPLPSTQSTLLLDLFLLWSHMHIIFVESWPIFHVTGPDLKERKIIHAIVSNQYKFTWVVLLFGSYGVYTLIWKLTFLLLYCCYCRFTIYLWALFIINVHYQLFTRLCLWWDASLYVKRLP